MALVAYDYESDSENEDDETNNSAVVILNNKSNNSISTENDDLKDKNQTRDDLDKTEDVTEKLPEILSQLPQTTKEATVNITDDKLEDFVPKYQPPPTKEKKTQKVRITIPALSEFDDDDEDEPEQKKPKVISKSSSLLAMLPPVKGSPLSTKSFIPNVLKNKPSVSNKKTSSLVPQAVRKKAEEAKMATIKKITSIATAQGSDVESDDDIEIPETFDEEVWHKVCGPKTKAKPQITEIVEETVHTQAINIAPEPAKPYDGLDNAAFKELVGKAKRPVNIKLIDINEEEIVGDTNLWLTKSLTDPDQAPKEVVDEPVDPTRKKKHHITYLAEQAKANEQELQTTWSANKFARNQTRAKYGF